MQQHFFHGLRTAATRRAFAKVKEKQEFVLVENATGNATNAMAGEQLLDADIQSFFVILEKYNYLMFLAAL